MDIQGRVISNRTRITELEAENRRLQRLLAIQQKTVRRVGIRLYKQGKQAVLKQLKARYREAQARYELAKLVYEATWALRSNVHELSKAANADLRRAVTVLRELEKMPWIRRMKTQ